MSNRELHVHTSDRILFKRCRRKWNWASPLRQNLRPKSESIEALWFGSAIHYALEDYHGYNHFGKPQNALIAYYDAHVRGELPMPEDAKDLIHIKGVKMLDHYLDWESKQEKFETVWWNDEPQVEAKWIIPLPSAMCNGRSNVYYAMTLDRVMTDKYGRWWICDYKTAAQFNTTKLEGDPQVTNYLLFAPWVYDVEFEGMVYLQLRKDYPSPPKQLVAGGLSMNKQQNTTSALYIQSLKEMFGSKIPSKYVGFVKYLQEQEKHGDKFIDKTHVRRSAEALDSEFLNLEYELSEMLNANLPLYPNPTRDCFWDCQFRAACIAQNDGGDYDLILDENFKEKEDEVSWREFLSLPS